MHCSPKKSSTTG